MPANPPVTPIDLRGPVSPAAAQGQDFFREAFAHASVGIAVTDLAGRFLQVNAAFCAITGYSEAELLPTTFLTITHPDDRASNLHLVQQLLAGNIASFDVEKRYLKKDGTTVWVLNSIALSRADRVQPSHLIALCQDITQRKQAEDERDRLLVCERDARAATEAALRALEQSRAAARASEEQYRSLANLVPGVVWTSRPDGWIDYANPFWVRYTGLTLEQTYGWGWSSVLHPDDMARVTDVWTRALQAGEQVDVEYRLRGADGSYRWFLARGIPVHDPNGQIIKWFGLLTDIEDQKRLEEERALLLAREQKARAEVEDALRARDDTLVALAASEAQYRVLAEVMHQCVWTAGADGQTDYVNQHWCTYAGMTSEQSLGAGWARVLHPDDAQKCFDAWARSVQTGENFECEYRMQRADGTYRWFLGRGLPVRDREGRIIKWLGTATDIDDQKRFEAELHKAKQAAEAANRAKSEFLSRMSHELRTPLNAILGFAQLLGMGEPTPRQRQQLEQIVKGGQLLLGLINEVLDLARIETGQVPLFPTSVRVRHLFAEVMDLIRPLAERRGIRLIAAPCEDDVHVLADDQRLRQVLLNLVSNAVKYNHEGGSVTLAVEELGPNRVRLLVHDTGPGLSPELQERLFNPFDRLGAETSGIEGTGLGLVVSKRLTEAMGGTLSVVSAAGQGSTFFVEIATAHSRHPQPECAGAVSAATTAAGPRGRTVLCVEDNLDNLALLEGILAYRPQVRLLSAVRGELGLDLASQHHPDLILLDVHLPDMKGDEVLRRLRADPQLHNTPVIVLSADATPHQIERLRAAGARDYLTKPIDVERFLDALDRFLLEQPARSAVRTGTACDSECHP
jgi:PAS domain S-box-containing protein